MVSRASHLCSVAESGHDDFFIVEAVSCHLAQYTINMVRLSLQSRGRTLLCCVQDGAKFLLDCVLCQEIMSRSLKSIAVLHL